MSHRGTGRLGVEAGGRSSTAALAPGVRQHEGEGRGEATASAAAAGAVGAPPRRTRRRDGWPAVLAAAEERGGVFLELPRPTQEELEAVLARMLAQAKRAL